MLCILGMSAFLLLGIVFGRLHLARCLRAFDELRSLGNKRIALIFSAVFIVLCTGIAGCRSEIDIASLDENPVSQEEPEAFQEISVHGRTPQEHREEVEGYIDEGVLEQPEVFLAKHSASAEEFLYPYWLFLTEKEQEKFYQNADAETRSTVDRVRSWFDGASWMQE